VRVLTVYAHVYFYRAPVCDAATRRGYLERAYQLGKEYAQ
jgi:hypothetical protein